MCINQETGDRRQKTGLLPRFRSDKVRSSVFCPLPSERGISLIELVVFIVIISIAIAGILLVMNKVTTHSADPLILKQEIASAESMLEEIELQDFIPASANSPVTALNRATAYHIVKDYDGFTTTGIYTPDNVPVPGLENYSLAVSVTDTTLGTIASAVQITVTVSNSTLPAGDPLSQTVIDGYRTAY